MKFEILLSIHTIEETDSLDDAILRGQHMAYFIQSIVNKEFWSVQFQSAKELPCQKN